MTPAILKARRQQLHNQIGGAIFLPGLNIAPKNYPKNGYPFRQDSHFLYFAGANQPGLAAMIFPDGSSFLYGTPQSESDIVWEGEQVTLEAIAWATGQSGVKPLAELGNDIADLQQRHEKIHYLPPYRSDIEIWTAELFHQPLSYIRRQYSREMAEAVVQQRIRKSPEEVAWIEKAIAVSAKMYAQAFSMIRPGLMEYEVMGAMSGIAQANQCSDAFLPIVTVHGEVLHNNRYHHQMEHGQLLLIDTGVELPPFCYGSDITRTVPVGGTFTSRQRDVYNVVLGAQQRAIDVASPTLSNREVHMAAALSIVDGLKDIGLMRGDSKEAVHAGAHTLLFPHGIGHMLGLDSHDMEDLGDFVAYPKGEKPPSEPGLQNLRLGRKLEPGFVITVEPGIYFIPALIDRWVAEKKHADFINYEEVVKFRNFGGIRIEDDILITEKGCRVLGPGIPKSIAEIEAHMTASSDK
ncbi:MAG: aminopeptidase P N-terminal domain-containing protein [Deltaproteobacteria bacterium]|nr:aminopeptidase P N-terminal domain-containing protein [Deltaproteobacteria bacterium]